MSPSPIRILDTQVISDRWAVLKTVTVEQTRRDGSVRVFTREAYDRGNGAVVLLYHRASRTVALTRQFRLPSYVNGNPTGFLIEACAGMLDTDTPEVCIRREVQEETGFVIGEVTRIMEAYLSPGALTEKLTFFTAEYFPASRVGPGGGIANEDIEVLELPFDEAYALIASGGIRDAKTILLLQYAKLHGLVG